jgi:hypothetical protein
MAVVAAMAAAEITNIVCNMGVNSKSYDRGISFVA